MMKKYFYILFGFLIVACNKNSDKKFEKLNELSWLEGNWGNKLHDGNLVENWTKENDSTFTAKSFYIKGKDTLHFEDIKLTQRKEDVFYIATVKGQNNDEPVEFKLNPNTESGFSFENPTHDYPQTIEYKKLSNNQMSATVSGKMEGKVNSDTYILNKK